MADRGPEDVDETCALLADGDLVLVQSLPWSSNGTWLASVSDGERGVYAVYKPRRAERPLWDFPTGTLCLREMSAFVISHALGWDLVPPTVLRDGPYGPGSVQRFIPHDPECHFLAMVDPDPVFTRRVAAFDVVINNADRKSGHVLRAADGRLWAIDHGIALHTQPKLRTVIWEHAGEPVPADILDDLAGLVVALGGSDPRMAAGDGGEAGDGSGGDVAGAEAGGSGAGRGGAGPGLRAALSDLLSPGEIGALRTRARRLVRQGVFPGADPRQRMIPWPPV